jgi:glycosyltransferase involved in cell wall biosynthesis
VIYYCIPAYNEAATVGVLLWKIRRVMEEFPRDYEILVLDDGSTDETLDVLAPYARVLPLTVIRQDARQGYAAAVERLIRETVGRSTHPRRDVLVFSRRTSRRRRRTSPRCSSESRAAPMSWRRRS